MSDKALGQLLYRWAKSVDSTKLDWWETELTIQEIEFVSEKSQNRKRWRITAYFETLDQATELKERYGGGTAQIRDCDWQTISEGVPTKIRIRDQFVVTDAVDSKFLQELAAENPGRSILNFPAQLAFGTGAHPTTACCLRLLCDANASQKDGEPWSMLDLGCGSGILSVAGEKLGADSIQALELDPMALRYAEQNAKSHDCRAIEFIEADVVKWLEQKPKRRYRVIAANIFSELLASILPLFDPWLEDDGVIILSGFLTSQTKRVVTVARDSGFEVDTFLRRGSWVAASGRRRK